LAFLISFRHDGSVLTRKDFEDGQNLGWHHPILLDILTGPVLSPAKEGQGLNESLDRFHTFPRFVVWGMKSLH
jgi:hypothetical protein